MRARVLLVTAVVLVAAAVWLWRRSSNEPHETTAAEPPAPPAHAPTTASQPTLAAGETTDRVRPALPDQPGEIKKIEIKRTAVQRDDGTASTGEPTFKQETLRAIREAAAPAVRRCIDDSFARHPEFRQQADIKGLVSAVFTVNATRGQVTVRGASVTVNGYNDDELAHCAEDAYNKLRIGVPATQGDGEGVVESGFDMR